MGNRKNDTVSCPNCGAEISRRARACPSCGSDEETGWSEDTYLDGIDLPDESEYEELKEKEFGERSTGIRPVSWAGLVGLLLLLLFLFGLLRGLF